MLTAPFYLRTQIVEKTGTTVNSTKRFVWLGTELAEERDGSNNVTRRFFGEGEQIGGTAYLFTRDHLGSVREMVDVSGVVQARYAYDPYGRRTKVSGSLEADFGFTGHYYHAPSQLHLALYRAYDAGKGRWICCSGFPCAAVRWSWSGWEGSGCAVSAGPSTPSSWFWYFSSIEASLVVAEAEFGAARGVKIPSRGNSRLRGARESRSLRFELNRRAP